MAEESHPTEESFFLYVVGLAGFAAIVALFQCVSPRAGIRGMGTVTLIAAGVHLITRRIPYGWEGRPPSGHLTGVSAIVVALLMGFLGGAMLFAPEFMLALFGWNKA